jgi:hypothetical protein
MVESYPSAVSGQSIPIGIMLVLKRRKFLHHSLVGKDQPFNRTTSQRRHRSRGDRLLHDLHHIAFRSRFHFVDISRYASGPSFPTTSLIPLIYTSTLAAVVNLVACYGLVALLRFLRGSKLLFPSEGLSSAPAFVHGKWSIKPKWLGTPMAGISSLWCLFIVIVLCLPEIYPVSGQNLNCEFRFACKF